MLHNGLRRIWLILLLGAIMAMLGCSGGHNPTTPSNSGFSLDNYQGGLNLGEFSLSLDSDSVTGNIEPVSREDAYNVTNYVKIKIVGLQWDPITRIWDIDVTVENPTNYNAYGPWIVFTNTGQQRILDQDGFIFAGPMRIPVVAFCKPNPQRLFKCQSIEPVHLRIHWPDGWSSFSPLNFFIDVSFPGTRQQPIVENLMITQTSPIPEQFNLTGFIKDWQTPHPGQPGLEVWVDLTPIGGPDHLLLFDDGQHGDGAPADDLWGCFFDAVPPPEPLPLTVHAIDWESYMHENDVMFGNFGPPPCMPMEILDQGAMSGVHQPVNMIVRDMPTWHKIWLMLHPGTTPPPVDFTKEEVVIVNLGGRPSSGYSVHIDCIFEEMNPAGAKQTTVNYTEEIPGQDCIVLWIATTPYQIVKTQLTVKNDFFIAHQHVYDCPPCQPMRPLAEGPHSLIHNLVRHVFTSQNQWTNFWALHDQNNPPPEVDWENEMVVAVILGDRPTGGFWVRMDCVQFIEDPSGGRNIIVDYTEMIPGLNCPTPDVITQPCSFVAVPRFLDANVEWRAHEEVYDCPPCEPMEVIAEGDMSNIKEPTELVLRDPHSWAQFWIMHQPDVPAPVIDFENKMAIAVILGERPSTGFFVTIDCVLFKSEPALAQCDVSYTEHIPGQNCITMPVITSPWQIVVVNKFQGVDIFHHNNFVYPCEPPPDCLPMMKIEEGTMGFQQPMEKIFRDNQSWAVFWHQLHPGQPVPVIDFTTHQVVTVMLGERRSSGFSVHIDCVKEISDPTHAPFTHVDYTEEIPGPECIVLWVLTYPYQIVATPLSATPPDEFNHMVHVYPCP